MHLRGASKELFTARVTPNTVTSLRPTGPRRCGLFVPGSSARMLAKAASLGADELVLDLEDSVAPTVKQQARRQVVEALQTPLGRSAVRVNEVGSQYVLDDIRDLVTAPVPPDSLVVPKVESRDDVVFLDRLLAGLEQLTGRAAPRLQLLVETARGLRRVDELLSVSARVEAVVLGYADLAASLRRDAYDTTQAPETWLPYQASVVAAARAAGVRAVDGPHLVLDDETGLVAAARRARVLGFDAKWAVHPAQLPVISAAFRVDEDELRAAHEVLAAAGAADQAVGALSVQGRMVDEAVLKQARNVLEQAGE